MPHDDLETLTDVVALVAPREGWYAAIASQRLVDKPVAARVLDWEIALWRDGAGTAHAVQDRCAHRGAQLSLGEVTDGLIACRYHGWRYGGDGACAHIPSLYASDTVPSGIGVRGFASAELDGYVYVWIGEGSPKPAAPARISDFERFNWIQGALDLDCPALAVIENNLDWCHPVFAHPFTHGQFFINQALGFREYEIELRLTDDGLVVFWPPTADPSKAVPTGVGLRFELPDRVTVGFSSGPQGPMRIVMHMTPTGPASCSQAWMVSQGPSAGAPELQWSDETHPIFEQDKLVLESAQRAVAREGHRFERSVEADAPTLLARRIYAAAAARTWPASAAAWPRRRMIKVRS